MLQIGYDFTERTFFEMIRLHVDIVRELNLLYNPASHRPGRHCFKNLYVDSLQTRYNSTVSQKYEKDSLSHLQDMYNRFLSEHQFDIDRMVYL